jgi:hypothetical protein
MPEAQTLLIVVASVEVGQPLPRATCRAGACPTPPLMTCPMKTSSMSDGFNPEREMAAVAAVTPNCGADTEANAPWNFPTGVRAAERMTTSWLLGGGGGDTFIPPATEA